MLKIGVDIGGTFTDFAAWREGGEGRVETLKVPSTPPDFAEAFKSGCNEILKRMEPHTHEEIVVVHGTTVATNTVIERNGPSIALFTTAGFRDILELQRLRLRRAIDLFGNRVDPLIPREFVFEIPERIGSDGRMRTRLDLEAVKHAAHAAKAAGVEGIAIAFLHSFRNPSHEIAARKAVVEATGLRNVSISSEIWPKIGEYERAIVAVLNTYVKPRMSAYIGEIERWLATRLPNAKLFIMQSNGGALSADEARELPVHTLLSGPASGVTAAQSLGAALNERCMLTMDMGGTSTDLSLIQDNEPSITGDAEVGDFPLMMPVTGIEAIGAGGGSVCWIDGGVLRVGPKSAGARPGPACFGHGGTLPTVTDAYLLCGFIDPLHFLGGRMTLDVDAARAAMQPVADALKMDVVSAAQACLTVATSNMVASVLPYLARYGLDPADVTLVVYGGAGSLHGPLLATELGIGRVLVPAMPSVFCAYGGLVAGLTHDDVKSVQGVTVSGALIQREFAALEQSARQWLASQEVGVSLRDVELEQRAEARYRGQSFQLIVNVPTAAIARGDVAAIEDEFHRQHERLYAHADPAAPVEFTELRLRIRGKLPMPSAGASGTQQSTPVAGAADGARSGERTLHIAGATRASCGVYARERLRGGDTLVGVAIIEQHDTTILVPPHYRATVDAHGNILLEKES
ncbi:N-methylhydantoinase A/acetone carboxylase, beta subunit [Burkholderia sp. Ch1-1]|uniref:N-methylhydantoinase A/acetone carboxylase, beta subunit n=1 Tax=Paraburkholderia dioscoreae TaxID=2604047 RepID=A0A5Q4Z2A9_9BURK|nr:MULTISPECIES: hydantoinase/oxoprolinase family protein [Paraburkholderia]EIF30492.1 N-methylhydantoinase A/acetone carboxylase, beta subunit [Burkholderia sp. Ch1-1]MDR8395084.1 hydantoinase/oxoprolinase family protein [Paraburkholderia sp. USG1]VVD29410.1 N-methylhydantoinase A/acetone carboxylase, beta subunit [Paraburkholderia dioscoreae]